MTNAKASYGLLTLFRPVSNGTINRLDSRPKAIMLLREPIRSAIIPNTGCRHMNTTRAAVMMKLTVEGSKPADTTKYFCM
ncbi:hypothetical protein D9M68_948130 [compost metagenome]